MKIAILGAGGLGKAAAQILDYKSDMQLVAIADAGGFVHDPNGVAASDVVRVKAGGSVADLPNGRQSDDAIGKGAVGTASLSATQ